MLREVIVSARQLMEQTERRLALPCTASTLELVRKCTSMLKTLRQAVMIGDSDNRVQANSAASHADALKFLESIHARLDALAKRIELALRDLFDLRQEGHAEMKGYLASETGSVEEGHDMVLDALVSSVGENLRLARSAVDTTRQSLPRGTFGLHSVADDDQKVSQFPP